MKVNISGVGLIPNLGLLAPVYGKDLSKETIMLILKRSQFKVYNAQTGIQITKINIDEVFGYSPKKSVVNTPTVITTDTATATITTTTPVVEKTVPKTTVEKKPEPVVVKTEEEEKEVVEDTTTATDEVEEKPAFTNKKKKRH